MISLLNTVRFLWCCVCYRIDEYIPSMPWSSQSLGDTTSLSGGRKLYPLLSPGAADQKEEGVNNHVDQLEEIIKIKGHQLNELQARMKSNDISQPTRDEGS